MAGKYDKKVLSIVASESGKGLLVRVAKPNVLYDRASLRSVQAITHWPVEIIKSSLGASSDAHLYFLMPASELGPDGFLAGMTIRQVSDTLLPLLKYRVPASKEKEDGKKVGKSKSAIVL